MKLPCGALVPPPLFGVAKDLALAQPGITTDAIFDFIKDEYPGLNPRWMKNVIGKARYAARHSSATVERPTSGAVRPKPMNRPETQPEPLPQAPGSGIPTSWLDPLLTGPKAAIGDPPYDCQDIERLLNAIRERMFPNSQVRHGGPDATK